ncbi:MAG TPA: 4Fe-4S dicluster domain-containing protein [Spirochaetota bacterium]|nr:4Fe-4S dicluster domain-containing protein [Spirochaetota bacterium]
MNVENDMNDQIYRRLRKEIDERMPVGMPGGEGDADISILKLLFSPEESEVAIHLSILPEKISRIHKRLARHGFSISLHELRRMLDSMVSKGAIMGGALFSKKDNYSLAQFAIGIYEFQVNRQTPEFARLAESYHEKSLIGEFFREDRPVQLRTIPVGKSFGSDRRISTYDDITRIVLDADEPVAVIDCVCKETRDLLAEPCRLSDVRNNCIMFGDGARYYLDRKIPSARKVSKEELFELLEKLREIGFVLQPANSRKPGFICACCGCCCNVLRGYKKLPRPSLYFSSNYYAEILSASCTGCKKCVARCQMDAIEIVDAKAVVNLDRCIGCGNCVAACRKNAIRLIEKARIKRPPFTSRNLYLKILLKKHGIGRLPGILVKLLFGRKI